MKFLKNIELTLFLELIMTTYGIQKFFLVGKKRLKICKKIY